MKREYTTQELCAQMESLKNLFDRVLLIDPNALAELDPVTQQPCGVVGPVPALDTTGRGVRRVVSQGQELLAVYQAIQVEGRPLVLGFGSMMPQSEAADQREVNAWDRTTSQYFQDLSRDYVTGAYNRRYLNEVFMPHAVKQAAEGQPISVVMARVNEYGRICGEEGTMAADSCLNTAAGVMLLAVGADARQAVLARQEDGVFVAAAVGRHAAELERDLSEALARSRREFNLSLSRRGTFTVSLAGADWVETGSWDMMLSLAGHRLAYQ